MIDSVRIERASVGLFPATETDVLGDWLFRSDDGLPNRRVNSAWDLGDPGVPIGEAVERVVAWYLERERQPMIKTTPGSLADEAVSGWEAQALTRVLIRPIDESLECKVEVWGRERLEEWCHWFAHIRKFETNRATSMQRSLERVTDPGLAAALIGGTPVAVGVGVVDEDLVGIQNVATVSLHRRRGHARTITESLMAWGREAGATTAFLQVEDENAEALSLYRSLGFSDSHSYHYRLLPI